MSIFNLFTLLGGLAFFLYGMNVMSSGLEKMAGGRLERTLKRMTSSKLRGLTLGMGITAAIQSSSAMTVMLVGLVNSGIMQLEQTISVIMGSNIGTTMTAWLLSLSGIESNNVYIKMLKPESFSPIVALIGIILIMLPKSGKKKDVGGIMVGFALLMTGMSFMSDSVTPLREMPEFSGILTMFSNPLLGVLVGAVFTGIIQSSSASVGILQALSTTGQLTYGIAIPIIMGQNIGTCISALISCIGTNKNAKRVTAVHVYFNLIGTSIGLALIYLTQKFIAPEFIGSLMGENIGPMGIALAHSIFNIFTTALLLPFSKLLEKLARLTIRDKRGDIQQETLIDERLLLTPSFAISECRSKTHSMARLVRDTLLASIELISHYDQKKRDMISNNEATIDTYEDKLGTYLVKLSSKSLTHSDSEEISKLLHAIGDLERIGDHAVNLMGVAEEIHDKGIRFSPEATAELAVFSEALTEVLNITIDAFINDDMELARNVEPLEQVIDDMQLELRSRHITRLQNGSCTIELGFVLSDLLTSYERISDHCSNIAVALLQIPSSTLDTHEFLDSLHRSNDPHYIAARDHYLKKFAISEKTPSETVL